MLSDLHISDHLRPGGKPWIYIHGGPGGNAIFFERLFFDSQNKISFITYDQRGGGRSKPGNYSISHDQNIRDLMEICRQTSERFGRFHVVAHSYGASLACAALFAHLIEPHHLVLLSPVFDFLQASRNIFLHIISLAKQRDFEATTSVIGVEGQGDLFARRQILIDRMVGDTGFASLYWANAATFTEYRRELLKHQISNEGYERLRPQLFNGSHDLFPNTPDELTAMAIAAKPDLILFGALDPMCDMYQQLAWLEIAPSTSVLGTGHFPHFEAPDFFLQSLLGLVSS